MHKLTLSTYDDLIAYVPHMMQFNPQGMVCVPLSNNGPLARLDLPAQEDLEPFVETLADVYLRRHPTQRIALLAFGEEGPACVETLSALGDRLGRDEDGIEVSPLLWVNGDDWFSVLDGATGTVDPSARTRMGAEFAVMGQLPPAGTREDLATSLQGDPAGVAEHLPQAQAQVVAMDLSALKAEGAWVGSRLDGYAENRKPLSDVDAARVLAVIHDSAARNEVESRMTRASAKGHTDLWQDLVRRAPEEVRDMPASMLALSFYLDGKGAQAWVALDQITETAPPLAALVEVALQQAISPVEWERAMQKPEVSALLSQAGMLHQTGMKVTAQDKMPPNHGHDGPSAPSR